MTEVAPAAALSLSDWLATTLAAIDAETDPTKREIMIQAFVKAVAEKDMPAVLVVLAGRNELGWDVARRLIRRWAESDLPAAMLWAEQLPPGECRELGIKGIALVMAGNNLTAAAQWVQQLPDDKARQSALTAVAYEMARTDPLQALTLAITLPESPTRDELLKNAAAQWAEGDSQAAADWASQINDQPLRTKVLATIATTWGGTDPVKAATMALDSLPAGRAQDNALVGIVQRWARRDPAQAAAWVAQFPEGPLKQAALENVVKLWADEDLAGGTAWVNSLPAGSLQNNAASILAGWPAPTSPASAAQ